MIKLIGFIGKRQSGKSTAAGYLVYEYGYTRLRFADTLKGMLRVLGLSDREIEGDLKECACDLLGGKTPRHAMITLGTEWGRDMIANDLWVRALGRQLNKHIASGVNKFVIDDVRFHNEANWINSLPNHINTQLVKIQRTVNIDSINHSSEVQQDTIIPNYLINNEGTLEQLYSSIDLFMENM